MPSATKSNQALWLLATTGVVSLSYLTYRYYQRQSDTKQQQEEDEERDLFAPVHEITLDSINLGDGQEEEEHLDNNSKQRILVRGSITIVHASVTGTCARMAQDLYQLLQTNNKTRTIQLGTTEDWDWWDEFINQEEEEDTNDTNSNNNLPPALLILLLPTYTNGTWPPVASNLAAALQDLQNDWRVAASPLKQKLQVAVWGMGSSEYDDHDSNSNDQQKEDTTTNTAQKRIQRIKERSMGKPARQAVRFFQKLGAKPIVRLAVGDDAVGDTAQVAFDEWKQGLVQKIATLQKKTTKKSTSTLTAVPEEGNKTTACGCSNNNSGDTNGTSENNAAGGCCQSETKDQKHANDEDDLYYSDDEEEEDDEDDNDGEEPHVMDVEDMGVVAAPKTKNTNNKEPREMVTPRQAVALKKEGYKLIGTHSAVKLCRWTKHQLRGRGGCYKHTFYGITSYQVGLIICVVTIYQHIQCH